MDLAIGDEQQIGQRPRTAVATARRRPKARPSSSRVAPPIEASSSDAAERARLLTALSLCLLTLCGLGSINVYLFMPAPLAAAIGPLLLASVVALSIAYAAARRGIAVLAASLIVTTQVSVPAVIYLMVDHPGMADSAQLAAWIVLPILTANAVLGPRAVLAVGAFGMTVLVAAELIGGASPHELANGALYLVTMTGAVFVYTRHRDRLETNRQAQLRRHNEELVDLQKTLEDRVEERTRDLAKTAKSLRETNESLQNNQALLVRAEKMAAVGRLTAGFAHELASPLGAVLAAVESLKDLRDEYDSSIGDDQVSTEDHRAIASEMGAAIVLSQQAAQRAVIFVRGIRAHTRDPGAAATERFDVGRVVTEAAELLGYLARSAGVSLRLEIPSHPVLITGVPSRLNQAITNLVHNAIDATGDTGNGGRVTVTVAPTNETVVISVLDDGPGMPPDVLERVFEPLFTTKAYGKGTGLGLAIVREIVDGELGGEIDVETRVGSGTTFEVRLPREGGARGA